jgi:intracellular septation protein
MNIFFDLFPLLLFFAAYKFMGIYAATCVAIVASLLQVMYTRIRYKKFELIQVVTCVMILVFGGMTLALHNPIFIKWKPTMINWILALVFLGSQLFNKQPLLQHLLKNKVTAESHVWRALSYMWIVFFIIVGALNLIVAYSFDMDTWVNFKVFGMLGLTLVFGIIQAFYLSKHAKINV